LSSLRDFVAARDFLLNAPNYREAKAGFKWPKMEAFNWALDYFDTLAERCSNPALLYVDDAGAERRVSFAALKENSNRVANFLRARGLLKGDRILLMLPNCVELFEIFLGAMKAGGVIIPASTLLTIEDIKDRIVRGKVRCVFTDHELAGKVDEAHREVTSLLKVILGEEENGWAVYDEVQSQPADFRSRDVFAANDPLLIYFTSGTTAKPKLVLHTHGSYPVGHLTTAYWIGARKGDLHYNVSQTGWAKYAWSSLFGAWNAETTSLLYNYSGRFDPKRALEVVEKYQVKTLCAPPTVWRLLILENLGDYRFALTQLVSAGEPLNPEIIYRVRDTIGLTIREGFGQSETTLQVGVFPGLEVKPGSMGVEAPGCRVEVLNDDIHPVAPKTDGMLAIRVKPQEAVGVMIGYIDPPEKNREVFVGDWYLTGDLASRDADGYFWFVGRADDVFKSSDYRISAFELESELMVHPSVTEVAVVASPDSLRGYVPKAFVTLKPHVVPSKELALELFRFTRESMAPYKRPRIIQFTPELPKTVSGKIKRTELRKLESDVRAGNQRSDGEYFESDFAEELKVKRQTIK
jgi:acetyl-CoA synthetase